MQGIGTSNTLVHRQMERVIATTVTGLFGTNIKALHFLTADPFIILRRGMVLDHIYTACADPEGDRGPGPHPSNENHKAIVP